MAGSKTLSKLYSADAVSATAGKLEFETASAGDKSDLVVQIQDCLIQLGFLDTITGEYDEATVAAVKAFQKANGLNPDGTPPTSPPRAISPWRAEARGTRSGSCSSG